MTREERIAALHDCIERQLEGKRRAERDLRELDEAMRETLREYMDLVAPCPERTADNRGGEKP